MLWQKKGKKVLLIDFDPQCNLSIAVLGQTDFTSKLPQQNKPYGTTIRSYLQRFLQNSIERELFTHVGMHTSSNVKLIAGDFWVNVYSESLNVGADLLSGTGIAKYTIIREILEYANKRREKNGKAKFDFALIDLPPSFGTLVRTAIYSSDYFVIPCTSDTFSAYCISLIGQMFPSFFQDWIVGVGRYNTTNPNIDNYDVNKKAKFAGWIFNGFDMRSGVFVKADATQYHNIKAHIDKHIINNGDIIKADGIKNDGLIGKIEDMNVLVQEGIWQSMPIVELKSTKPSGSMQSKRTWAQNQIGLMEELGDNFNKIADNIIRTCV